MTTASPSATDVIAVVQRDHREIEQLLSRVESSADGARQDAFEDLVRKLAVHETAEEEVVHPMTRKAAAGGIFDSIVREEDTAKRSLSDLDGVNVGSSEFEQQFATLKHDVLAHAQHEEHDEHPALRANESPEKLERLARIFEMAERSAPTRPHPNAPESRSGNLLMGPVLAVTDRVRDMLRDAMKGE